MIDICKRLREIREAKGLSQSDIEERLGMLRSTVSRIECGYYVPRVKTLEKWASVLGVSLAELFTEGRGAQEPFKEVRVPFYEQRLLEWARRLNQRDKRLLVSIAKTMVKQESKA